MKTDYEKLQMRIKFIKDDIRKICSSAHWTSERLKAADGMFQSILLTNMAFQQKRLTKRILLGDKLGDWIWQKILWA